MHKTIKDITEMKGKEKITVLTGYDSTMVTLCDQVDVILVGDSAGMVMLVIVLQSVGKFDAAQIGVGLTLIFAVDRILDMCRTTVNVTGDATVATVIAKSEGKLGSPHVQNWDDDYPQKTKQ